MGYRESDEPVDSRMDRLEASVKAGRGERIVSMLRIGINTLAVAVAVCGCIGLIEYMTDNNERDAQLALDAQATRDSDARDEAAMMCSTACEANGLSYERAHTRGARAMSCMCASETRRVTLWNDLRSPDTALRAQCVDACAGVGATISRAILRPYKAQYYNGNHYVPADPGEVLACSCNTPTSHRVLWDDRR